ncbi:unnamed protein product [Pelagomonas calceolata]|uniref:AB hydrolase-1 domain-containing protein n=1 Tax=Pelagomonas calceolata TaxID=35677 RepID=A0A6S8VS28_9STRA|nr:unnamed protein product [Pelagomonas calceolata]
MRAALTALAAVLLSQHAAAARRLRHRRRWRASRFASRRSPFATHTTLPDAQNCSWKALTQQLDHFGSIEKTFDQRLCLYDGFATKNITRVLLYVGNESPVDEYVNNTGLMWEYAAKRPGTLLVWAEHRYEARSTPDTKGMRDCLSFCTVEQALADYAVVIQKLRAIYGQVPVVAVGGSYGGMLAAWFRLKYPASVQGAIAASAPIWGLPLCRPPLNGGAIAVARAFGKAGGSEHCARNLRGAFPLMNEIGKTPTGRTFLSERFRLCPGSLGTDEEAGLRLAKAVQGVFFDVAEADYPFPSTYITSAVGPGNYALPAWPARVACSELLDLMVDVTDDRVTVDGVSISVDWDATSSDFFPTASVSDLESMPHLTKLLHGALGAWSVWCNVTHTLKCFDPSQCDSSNGDSPWLSHETHRLSDGHVDGVEAARRRLDAVDATLKQQTPPFATTTKSDTCSTQYAGGAASAWEPVVCNDDLNLVNYLHQGDTDGLYWPPNHAPNETLEDALGPIGSKGAGCAPPPGLAGYPTTSDPWSQWLDAYFGRKSLEGYSNIIFSNGLLDPWSSAGVYDDLTVIEPGRYTGPWLRNLSSSKDVSALILPLGAHHLDLMFSDDDDPPEAPYARRVEFAAIDRWTS